MPTRRDLLLVSTLGYLALAPAPGGHAFGAPSRRGAPDLWADHPTPELTPVDRLYVQSWNRTPSFDTGAWRLEVGGLVERPLALSLERLRARASFTQPFTLICIGNTVSGEQIGNIVWTGVRLADVLREARIRPDAVKLLVHAADGFTQTLDLETALAPTAMIAFAMNGVPLTADHGSPARLVVPGRYGVKNVKWVTRIEATADATALGYWERKGWDEAAVIRTTSRVDTPQFFGRIARRPVLVAGVAYAGDRGIASVEVSIDGTKTWRPAALKPPMGPVTWTLWAHVWRPERAGEHVLAARATDGRGGPQLAARERAFPKGSGGLHEVVVEVLPAAIRT